MTELAGNLQALGIELPSVAYLVGAVLFGLIGVVAWYRGKRSGRRVMRWAGLALMLYPYVVSATWLLYLIGVALTAWAFTSKA